MSDPVREAFEAWHSQFSKNQNDVSRWTEGEFSGEYIASTVQMYWVAWQAAYAAGLAAGAAAEREACAKVVERKREEVRAVVYTTRDLPFEQGLSVAIALIRAREEKR